MRVFCSIKYFLDSVKVPTEGFVEFYTIEEVEYEYENFFVYYSSSNDETFLANKKDVAKAADSIVDLLDKIIIITTPGMKGEVWRDIYSDKLTAVAVFKDDQRKDKFSRDFSRCMGAVWADDGLRYVAEYKDGRWELL